MARTFPPDTRPASLPLASGADTDVAPPVAGLAALGAAGVALSAAAAWVAATGAGAEPRGFSAAAHALVIAAPMTAGLYAVSPTPTGALRLVAGPCRGAVVAHDAGRVVRQRALQHRPGLGLVGRAAADLSRARISLRPVGEPRRSASRPSRGRRRVAVRRDSVSRRVSGAEPVGHVRHRLPSQRLHAAELRARLRRSRAHARRPSGEHPGVRLCRVAASPPSVERQQPDAPRARARTCCGRRANACDRRFPDRTRSRRRVTSSPRCSAGSRYWGRPRYPSGS